MTFNEVISDDQLRLFYNAFKKRDKDNDGKINKDEFQKTLKGLSIVPTPEELKEMEKDFIGETIDIYRFVFIIYHYIRSADSQEELIRAFSVFDPQGKGVIKVDDVRNILSNLRHPVPANRIDEMVQKLDPKGKGLISIEELVKYIRPN